MPDKAQPEGFGKIPDYEVAGFRKKLLEMYEETPPAAERYIEMISLVAAGVPPETAAQACGVFEEWEELDWLRQSVDTAWARFKSKVLVNLGQHLTGKNSSGPNATLANLFLKAHCGFNEKSAEGWHQTVKILPVVSASAGIQHHPDRDYWEYYQEREEKAELEAAAAQHHGETAAPESKTDEIEPG